MVTVVPTPWPHDLDVLVLPGIAGKSDRQLQTLYPSSSSDFIKLLREGGLRVDYAGRERGTEVAQKAIDVFVPVLVFTSTVAAGTISTLLASAIQEVVGKRRLKTTAVHLKLGRTTHSDGTIDEWIELDGPAEAVIAELRKRLHDGTDGPDN
jgi:hypothetical protein